MAIAVKRVYETASNDDGVRILVDRLWPRGLSKERARIDHWIRDVAPSDELRRWFNHEPAKWDEFRRRYFEELKKNDGAVRSVWEKTLDVRVTLVFAAKDENRNNAVALREYLVQSELP